jgi:hypothetical protein
MLSCRRRHGRQPGLVDAHAVDPCPLLDDHVVDDEVAEDGSVWRRWPRIGCEMANLPADPVALVNKINNLVWCDGHLLVVATPV